MGKLKTLTDLKVQDFKNILDHRLDLLRNQEELRQVSLIKTLQENSDDRRSEFSESKLNTSAEQDSAQRHYREITSIEQALLKIAEGSFGKCIDCQLTIDFARLLASPNSLRCMTCQVGYEKHEKRQDPTH